MVSHLRGGSLLLQASHIKHKEEERELWKQQQQHRHCLPPFSPFSHAPLQPSPWLARSLASLHPPSVCGFVLLSSPPRLSPYFPKLSRYCKNRGCTGPILITEIKRCSRFEKNNSSTSFLYKDVYILSLSILASSWTAVGCFKFQWQ